MKHYEVVKSEKVFSGKILDVVHERIIMPDNTEADREIVVRGSAAAVVAVDAGGKLYFVRQYRAPFHEMTLEIPAGMTEGPEDPILCAERELTEETGMIAGSVKLIMSLRTAIGFCDEVIHIYLARDLRQGRQKLDADEFIEIERYSLEQAISMIFSGEISDAKTIAGVLAYKELTRK